MILELKGRISDIERSIPSALFGPKSPSGLAHSLKIDQVLLRRIKIAISILISALPFTYIDHEFCPKTRRFHQRFTDFTTYHGNVLGISPSYSLLSARSQVVKLTLYIENCLIETSPCDPWCKSRNILGKSLRQVRSRDTYIVHQKTHSRNILS